MQDPGTPPDGDPTLEAVTAGLVELHERYHGRKPVNAHSQMMGDDLLACLMGEVYTDVEQTLIELQRTALVQETRSAFQQAMGVRFVKVVERATSRKVVRFLSTHHVGPDLELELFFLGPLPNG